MRSSLLPKLGALATVVAAFACSAALWPSGALASVEDTIEYVHIGTEGQVVTPGWGNASYITYGADGHYIQKGVDGPFPCTNEFFGGDPAPGVHKYCDVIGRYHYYAAEGDPVQGGGVMLYGQTMSGISTDFWTGAITSTPHEPDDAAGHWIIKSQGDAGSCTNSYFGADPWPNVKKYCWTVEMYH